MTDAPEESQSQDRVAGQGEPPTTPLWQRFLLLAAAGAVIAGFALLGYWSLYCRDVVEAVLWSLIFVIGGTSSVAANEPDLFWGPLLGYVAVVFIVCRYTPFRLT